MSYSLPAGWVRTTLGQIGRYLNGRAFKSSEWSDQGRMIIRIQDLTGTGDSPNFFDGEVEPRYEVRAGDLLISWAATLGAYIWRGPDAVLNQHIFKVESFIDQRFHYWLVTAILDDLKRQAHGSGMVHITKGRFDATPIDLPPLAEQRRIVAALEEHLSALDAAVAGLVRARANAQRFALSAKEHALSACEQVPLIELLESPLSNGRSVPTSPDGFPVLRLTALKNGRVDLEESKQGAWTHEDAKPFLVSEGDFMIARGNGSKHLVGRGALVGKVVRPVAYPDTMIRVRVRTDRMLPEFLRIVWDSRAVRTQIEAIAKTTAGIYKVNQHGLEQVLVPIYKNLEDQQSIVQQNEIVFGAAERGALEIGSQLVRAARLRQSILQRAFSGALVSQDPDDEPAGELLARVTAKTTPRASAPSSPRGRKRATTPRRAHG